MPQAKLFTTSKGSRENDWIRAMLGAIGAGLVVVAILGLTNGGFGRIPAVFSGLLLASASILSGGFFGFLFGIPRSKQVQDAGIIADGNGGRQYVENTNLEQISDWLTKIIIGLTLVQYQQISDFIANAGNNFGPVFITNSNSAISQSVAVAIIIYFFLTGFLFFYLWTRIYMESLLRRQHALLDSEIESIINDSQEQQSDTDANAMELVDAYLEKKSDPAAKKFNNIEVKVSEASLFARTMIFSNARKVRQDNWRKNQDPELMQRTIPVFQGLIKAAPNKYHRNYGQLGYALTRKPTPDWAGAKAVLETAIALRGPDKDAVGSGLYEFHLALANINLDPEFQNRKPSGVAVKAGVIALLDSGKEVLTLSEEPAIKAWAKLNDHPIPDPVQS